MIITNIHYTVHVSGIPKPLLHNKCFTSLYINTPKKRHLKSHLTQHQANFDFSLMSFPNFMSLEAIQVDFLCLFLVFKWDYPLCLIVENMSRFKEWGGMMWHLSCRYMPCCLKICASVSNNMCLCVWLKSLKCCDTTFHHATTLARHLTMIMIIMVMMTTIIMVMTMMVMFKMMTMIIRHSITLGHLWAIDGETTEDQDQRRRSHKGWENQSTK